MCLDKMNWTKACSNISS